MDPGEPKEPTWQGSLLDSRGVKAAPCWKRADAGSMIGVVPETPFPTSPRLWAGNDAQALGVEAKSLPALMLVQMAFQGRLQLRYKNPLFMTK